MSAFAWVPTVTSVSRQALFAGKSPFYFKETLFITGKEERHWLRFWEENGVSKSKVKLFKGLGDQPEEIKQICQYIHYEILGLVVDKLDRISHGMELGLAGMHQQVELWLSGGYLEQLISALLGENFSVYLASDHGNVWAAGAGRPMEGCLVEKKGERARIYDSPALLHRAQEEAASGWHWHGYGLPEDIFVLLAGGKTSFLPEGDTGLVHGGVSLEEVIVPLIRIGKENKSWQTS
jgi:hypothetical protein